MCRNQELECLVASLQEDKKNSLKKLEEALTCLEERERTIQCLETRLNERNCQVVCLQEDVDDKAHRIGCLEQEVWGALKRSLFYLHTHHYKRSLTILNAYYTLLVIFKHSDFPCEDCNGTFVGVIMPLYFVKITLPFGKSLEGLGSWHFFFLLSQMRELQKQLNECQGDFGTDALALKKALSRISELETLLMCKNKSLEEFQV